MDGVDWGKVNGCWVYLVEASGYFGEGRGYLVEDRGYFGEGRGYLAEDRGDLGEGRGYTLDL